MFEKKQNDSIAHRQETDAHSNILLRRGFAIAAIGALMVAGAKSAEYIDYLNTRDQSIAVSERPYALHFLSLPNNQVDQSTKNRNKRLFTEAAKILYQRVGYDVPDISIVEDYEWSQPLEATEKTNEPCISGLDMYMHHYSTQQNNIHDVYFLPEDIAICEQPNVSGTTSKIKKEILGRQGVVNEVYTIIPTSARDSIKSEQTYDFQTMLHEMSHILGNADTVATTIAGRTDMRTKYTCNNAVQDAQVFKKNTWLQSNDDMYNVNAEYNSPNTIMGRRQHNSQSPSDYDFFTPTERAVMNPNIVTTLYADSLDVEYTAVLSNKKNNVQIISYKIEEDHPINNLYDKEEQPHIFTNMNIGVMYENSNSPRLVGVALDRTYQSKFFLADIQLLKQDGFTEKEEVVYVDKHANVTVYANDLQGDIKVTIRPGLPEC